MIINIDLDALNGAGFVLGWDDLSAAIGSAIDTFTPAECANYFAAAGYDAY